jgi:hypothetical protein
MGEGDEVVNEIDGPHARIPHPLRKTISIQAGVADVQIKPAAAVAGAAAKLLQAFADERRSEPRRRVAKQVE